jgi:ADP-ribose pyrophosphatase
LSHDLTRPRGDLSETKVSSEPVFHGELLNVRRDVVRLPNGKTSTREYIVHPGAVAIVALLDDNQIVLERQFRYPLGRVIVELPAGKRDPGEDALTTGKRELLEETGYVAADWRHMLTFYPLVAYADERIEIYLAKGLRLEKPRLDDGEHLEVFSVSVRTALDWVRDNTIVDAKTIISLLWLERELQLG